jgi:hypothetical protein
MAQVLILIIALKPVYLTLLKEVMRLGRYYQSAQPKGALVNEIIQPLHKVFQIITV